MQDSLSKAACLHAEPGWMKPALSTVGRKSSSHCKGRRPSRAQAINTHGTESRVTLWVLWMHVCYNLGAHRAELGMRNPSRSGSCHLNLSGKHSAADLNGMERKYNLGIARLFGRLGHRRGRENTTLPTTRAYPQLRSWTLFELNFYSHFCASDMFIWGRIVYHVSFVNFENWKFQNNALCITCIFPRKCCPTPRLRGRTQRVMPTLLPAAKGTATIPCLFLNKHTKLINSNEHCILLSSDLIGSTLKIMMPSWFKPVLAFAGTF